jgi:hypothetical protein
MPSTHRITKGGYRPPTHRSAMLTPGVPLRGRYAEGAQEQERAQATCASSTAGARGEARIRYILGILYAELKYEVSIRYRVYSAYRIELNSMR